MLTDQPLTPERVWRAIRGASKRPDLKVGAAG